MSTKFPYVNKLLRYAKERRKEQANISLINGECLFVFLTVFLLKRLAILLTTLQGHHSNLRQHNEKLLETGIAMGKSLEPIETGVRLEHERRAMDEASKTAEISLQGEVGESADDPISTA